MASMIRIVSKREGFRRAGMTHSTKPVMHPVDKFSKLQLQQLKAEPLLDVQIVDVPEPKEKEK